ncbi:LysR family transcriptional regulator [Kingella sp. SNUBH-2017]|jgi:transcriptional regulator, lysR family|uniref:LysR family transcriptional regulator n=1 Tax=Kingella pumchi TaxID=2779506 RepID=A0ABS9NPZ1_9NEIS|nr:MULTISPECIES: LysR family transcriptional regulator [Kingella]MCG6504863.1 LysR family transcriptional regulator [Kingella pumchi]MDD2183164.1 LysR family transcriptional regulator [Kingella sp. SNUBH-2017]
MDINQLRAFITVAHTQNLTQAAEKLFLSQPAVSAQIKALEADVGTPLFTRTNSGMTLTRAGEVLLPEAEELLQHKHRLEVFAQTLSEDYIHHARLGLIHPIRADKVSRLTRSIVRREPGVQLHIQYGMSGEILSRILAKRLHGGFFLGPLNQRTLQSVPLEHIAYSLICHTDDESRLRSGLPRSLNDFTWIEMSGVSGSHKNLQQFWHRHKLTPKKQIICDYPQAIIGLAADGIGLAMVPKHSAQAAQAQGSPIALIDEFEQQLPMSFVYLDEYGQDPALALLRDAVQEVWQTAPPVSEAA